MPTVPCKATHNLFIPDGRTDPALSQKGPLAVATPGALAAYAHALKHHGPWPLRVPLEAAATLAEQGFPLQKSDADRLRQEAKAVSASPGCRALLVRPDGATLSEGDWLRQPDLIAFIFISDPLLFCERLCSLCLHLTTGAEQRLHRDWP